MASPSATQDPTLNVTHSLFMTHAQTPPLEPRNASTPQDVGAAPPDAGLRRAAWERGPIISELQRDQYAFEGGGAASERRVDKRPGWLSRLFRRP